MHVWLQAGHPVILANGNNGEWYLNDGFGNGDAASSRLPSLPF